VSESNYIWEARPQSWPIPNFTSCSILSTSVHSSNSLSVSLIWENFLYDFQRKLRYDSIVFKRNFWHYAVFKPSATDNGFSIAHSWGVSEFITGFGYCHCVLFMIFGSPVHRFLAFVTCVSLWNKICRNLITWTACKSIAFATDHFCHNCLLSLLRITRLKVIEIKMSDTYLKSYRNVQVKKTRKHTRTHYKMRRILFPRQ